MKKSISLAALLLLAVTVVFAGGKADGDTVKIGAVFALSGPVAFGGIQARAGAQLAVDELNAAGGILGKKVALISEDDEGDPAKSVNAFNKLTTQDKAAFIVGSNISGTTMSMTALAQQRKVVLITPTGTNPKVTDAGDFIFRACFIDPFQGVAAADFASANLKARRAVILFDAGADYNSGLAGEFRKQFLKNGGQIVADEGYQSGDVDFNAQITRIKGANPDVVYLPNYYNDAALQGSQLRSQGISCAILGCDGWPGIEGAAGPDFPPAYWSTGFARDTTDPRGVAFVKAFEAANPHTYAESQAAHGYDSVMIIANAIKAAGTLDTVAVKDAMAKTDGDYITGHIRYDAHRDPIKAATILEIVKRDNKLVNVYSTTINPK